MANCFAASPFNKALHNLSRATTHTTVAHEGRPRANAELMAWWCVLKSARRLLSSLDPPAVNGRTWSIS